MATDRHERNHTGWATLPSFDSAVGPADDSFSDNPGGRYALAGIDPERRLDSDAKCIRTDLPELLDSLLPGEAALVYQYLRGRLSTLFDDAGR